MKRAAIQRLVPYEADYNRLSKYRKIGTWGLWTISACTVILPVLNYFSTNAVAQTIYNVINFLYFLIIIFYYILLILIFFCTILHGLLIYSKDTS